MGGVYNVVVKRIVITLFYDLIVLICSKDKWFRWMDERTDRFLHFIHLILVIWMMIVEGDLVVLRNTWSFIGYLKFKWTMLMNDFKKKNLEKK